MTKAEEWALQGTTANVSQVFREMPNVAKVDYDGLKGEIRVLMDSGARYRVLIQHDDRDEARWEEFRRGLVTVEVAPE